MGWASRNKMQIEIVIDNSKRFKLLYEGFRAWAQDPQHAQKRTSKQRKLEAEIITQLNNISDPVGDTLSDDEFDYRNRKLKNSGSDTTIKLSGTAFALLKERIDEAPMRVEVAQEVEDLLDWLEGSHKKME